ncbi:MAG: 4-amino-4-deoxy-L-arabinose transferase-like glycosyltransferase [Maribacter sp.]|jgi:4-amino-4-deoxy-L-arabinose transferase-like glycosyltransferase
MNDYHDISFIAKRITLGIFLALLLPVLVQDGMFLDGVTYATISKNMANGIGSFWSPHYTQILYPEFYEHPPLVFGIQSILFRILGNGIYTERIYTLLTAILTTWGIIQCWKLFSKQRKQQNYAWLPVLLWISIPIVFWSYSNNMLENTMGVFTIFSVFFLLKSMINQQLKWLLLGSVFILGAFLSKGLVGLFPLAIPAIYYVVFRDIKIGKSILYSFFTLLIPSALFYFITLLYPESLDNITTYFNQQLLPSLNKEREVTASNRFSIMLILLIEMIFPIFLVLFFVVKNIIIKNTAKLKLNKPALLFLLIGLSASIPLMVSLKQRGFYLIPSIPFYILSCSYLIYPYIENVLEKLSNPIKFSLKIISYLILIFALSISTYKIGHYSRDESPLKDIHTITKKIDSSQGTILGTRGKGCPDWMTTAYLNRVGGMSVECGKLHEYFITKTGERPTYLNEKYVEMDWDLEIYRVFKKD